MADEKRFTVTIEGGLYDRLLDVTSRRKPRLPKRYVVELALTRLLDAANAGLPDYARVRHWVRARAAFDTDAGLATANGRPQRAAIEQLHRDALAGHALPSPFFPEPSIS